jgi:hypothetical protein
MTSLPHGTLPLATTPAFTGSSRVPPHDAGGWKQALARASAGATPATPAPASGRTLQVAPVPQALFAVPGAPATPVPAASGNAARTDLAGPSRAIALVQAVVAGDRAAGANGAHALPAPAFPALAVEANGPSEPPVTEAGDDGLHLPRARASAPEASAPRVHVEWHDDGLAVWLGLDAGPQAAAQAAGLLDALRRHGRVLPRLALLVCNGVPIPTHPLPPRSKETP